jgi:hypothetical protein
MTDREIRIVVAGLVLGYLLGYLTLHLLTQ